MEKADNLIDLEVGEAEQELMEKLQESMNTSTLVERKRTDGKSLFFFTPVQGSTSLNPKDNNPSVLITGARNASVKSVLDGKVIFVGHSKNSGFTMIIFHNANFISAYKNLNQITKNLGDMVKVGEVIGVLGSTRDPKEKPILQFELIQDGRFVDPFQFISFR
jgi:murein DD-endopeptidase MepM/ murein hydrolase activator NlpD